MIATMKGACITERKRQIARNITAIGREMDSWNATNVDSLTDLSRRKDSAIKQKARVDMRMVIDINENDYKTLMINGGKCTLSMAERIVDSVYQGKKLLKGHGDLKDMGNLQYVFDLTREEPIYSGKDIEWAIRSMKTIIKADTAESEMEE